MSLLTIRNDRIGDDTQVSLSPRQDLLVKAGVTIHAELDTAIEAIRTGAQVRILGTVSSAAENAIGLGDSTATGMLLTVARSGSVFGDNVGILVGARSARIVNLGHIDGDVGVSSSGNLTLINRGTIGGDSYGVVCSGDRTIIRNEGRITSINGFAIDFDSEDSLVTNTGVIRGSLQSFDGDDVFRLGGTVIGDVFGGEGNDLVDTSRGRFVGEIELREGNDRFIAGRSAEAVDGGVDDTDTLDFRKAGAVTVNLNDATQNRGAARGDTYINFENILGSSGNDRLTGADGSLVLAGNGGNDVLRGGDEPFDGNILIGGAGRDRMTGGAGFDAFRYARPGEGGDRITDFFPTDRFEFKAQAFDLGDADGLIAAGRFKTGDTARAGDRSDRFIWEADDTKLWFDVDGTGRKAPVLIADLQEGATVTEAQIYLY